MRLKHLRVKAFKNLRDFSIDFDTSSPTTVLVGRNGTGKSNLLEVLTIIFRDLDLGEGPNLAYRLEYECRGHQVAIDTDQPDSRQKAEVTVDGKKVTYNQLSKGKGREYLPNFVFGYYSGPSNRMEEHFEKHQERFYQDLLKGKDRPLRPLFYARLVHSQFVLLGFFLEDDPQIHKFLKESLRIEGIDSVLFVMREPPWDHPKDPHNFWGARGVVRELLKPLYKLALAPLCLVYRVPVGFRKTTMLEHLYLYLKDIEGLRDLAGEYTNRQEFFKALESTYISKLISEVRIRVRARNIQGALTFRELSEGEQQLLMVLGLLRFTREDESLFLLDEPDTHLNPAWSLQYLDMLKRVAGLGSSESSHLLMATHDPLVISGLEKSQVRIFQRDSEGGNVQSVEPEHDPKELGVGGLLTSDIYGLRTTLHISVQKLLDKHRQLASKKGKLTKKEKVLLERYNKDLRELGLVSAIRDPLYERFLVEWTKQEDEAWLEGADLTPKQQKDQAKLAHSIVEKLAKERGMKP